LKCKNDFDDWRFSSLPERFSSHPASFLTHSRVSGSFLSGLGVFFNAAGVWQFKAVFLRHQKLIAYVERCKKSEVSPLRTHLHGV